MLEPEDAKVFALKIRDIEDKIQACKDRRTELERERKDTMEVMLTEATDTQAKLPFPDDGKEKKK